MNEDQLCLEWFRDIGWQVLHGPDIAHNGPLRHDYKDVFLRSELREAAARINPHLPAETIGCH